MRGLIVVLVSVAGSGWAEEARGIRWQVPSEWHVEGPRPIRLATYSVPRAAGDQDVAECAVFGFASGTGGEVEDAIDLWLGQFEFGEPVVPFQLTLGRLRLTFVEVEGTIRTNLPSGGAVRPAFILLGAIVEGPSGRLYFKLVGPRRSVEAAREAFGRMVRGTHT
jgi:hypothetical protein